MTKPDFDKIFASGGTTLPLTDSQFLQGFAYLGENPPTKEEFNWLFQQLCLKMQWLNQNAGFGRWQADHTYAAGEICFSSVIGDYRFAECTIGGQSGTAEPTWGAVGNTVTDGGVTWIVKDLRQGTSIGKIPALIDVGGGKAGLPAVSGKLLTDISGVPIGTVVPFLATKAQPGWLACDTGALVSRATYAELWTWVQANAPLISEADWQTQAAAQSSVGAYSTGDGSTTFRLPRILDYVRGGLTADVGTWQGDAIRNITGSFGNDGYGGSIWNGAFAEDNIIYTVTNSAGGADTGTYKTTFDASRVVPTAEENRPKTVKMLYCVKAFDATTNQGLIDITALANEMAAKVNSVDVGFKIVYPNGGTAENPATITINSRYVISNPFPGYFIQCKAQVFDPVSQKWITWDNMVSTDTTSKGYGLCTNYNSTDDAIVVQTGLNDIWGASNLDGNPFNRAIAAGVVVSAQCRVLVWKGGSLA